MVVVWKHALGGIELNWTVLAFNQIRQYSKSDVAVTIRLLEAIAYITTYTRNSKQREALRRHAEMILNSSREQISQEQDQKDVQ